MGNLTDLVHALYHSSFPTIDNRKSIVPAIRKDETIAILNEDKTKAISAITFLAVEKCVVVLWFLTDEEYWSNGMGTFLLSVSYHVLWCRENRKDITYYLKANEKANHRAFSYYKRLGFEEMAKKKQNKKIPRKLSDCFMDEMENSPFNIISKLWMTV